MRLLGFVFWLMIVSSCTGGGLVFEDDFECPEGSAVVDPGDSIQDALDASADGDTICLTPGRYTQTLLMPATEVRLLGAAGWEHTIIDAVRQGPVVQVNGAPTLVTLEGITITGGYFESSEASGHVASASGLVVAGRNVSLIDVRVTDNLVVGSSVFGAGILVFADGGTSVGGLTMERVRVDHNRVTSKPGAVGQTLAVEGIGMRLFSNVTMRDVVVSHNEVTPGSSFDRVDGGGLHVWLSGLDAERLVVFGNEISATDSASGAGLFLNGGSLRLKSSIVAANTATAPRAFGGGVAINRGTLEDVDVVGNLAQGECAAFGGGVAVLRGFGTTRGNADLSRVRLVSNEANGDVAQGGGLFAGEEQTCASAATSTADAQQLDVSQLVVANNRVAGALERGSAIFSERLATIAQSTLTMNLAESGARALWLERHADAQSSVTNTIVALHGGGIEVSGTGLDPTVSFTALFNQPGEEVVGMIDVVGSNGNESIAPAFTSLSGDPQHWDLRLQSGSTLIDAGDPLLIDPDGTRSDPGAFGGPDAALWVDLSISDLVPAP